MKKKRNGNLLLLFSALFILLIYIIASVPKNEDGLKDTEYEQKNLLTTIKKQPIQNLFSSNTKEEVRDDGSNIAEAVEGKTLYDTVYYSNLKPNDIEECSRMVQEVNQTQVVPEERLTDRVDVIEV